jgi:hypothetical protein
VRDGFFKSNWHGEVERSYCCQFDKHRKNQNYAFSNVIAFSSTLATHLIKIMGVSNRSSPKKSYTRENNPAPQLEKNQFSIQKCGNQNYAGINACSSSPYSIILICWLVGRFSLGKHSSNFFPISSICLQFKTWNHHCQQKDISVVKPDIVVCCVGAKEKKKIHVGHVRKTLESLHFGGS